MMLTPILGETKQQFINRYTADTEVQKLYTIDKTRDYVANNVWRAFVTKALDESVYRKEVAASILFGDSVDVPLGITKVNESAQQVFGWANVAIEVDGLHPFDWDLDQTDPIELEKAAYTFVLKYRETGEMHQGEAKGQLIESVMLTKEKQEALGIPPGIVPEGWWVGFHVPDEAVFKKVLDGTYKMFSVQGTAKRVPVGGE